MRPGRARIAITLHGCSYLVSFCICVVELQTYGYDFVFFFSSRRRHTRYWRDWSSDVCSSDLSAASPASRCNPARPTVPTGPIDRKSVVEGKSVELGGRRITKKKENRSNNQ